MYMSFPCLLAATLEGTLIGSLLPAPANRILHPIIVTCLVINAAAAVFGSATGLGYQHTLEIYLTKVRTLLLMDIVLCPLQASHQLVSAVTSLVKAQPANILGEGQCHCLLVL